MDQEVDSVAWGWSDYFAMLSRFFQDLERQSGIASLTYSEYAVERLENCQRVISHLSGVLATSAMETEGSRSSVVLGYGERLSTLQGLLQSLHVEWQQYRDSVERASVRSRYHAPVEHRPFGRPRFLIQPDQLEYLRSLSFTWVEIASLFCVSRMTIYRRRVEYDMLENQHQIPSDAELLQLVRQINHQLPYLGEIMVMGRLRAMGYHVTRSRLRQALHEVDPINIAMRWGGNAHARRPYSVPGPNSLWHIGKDSSVCYIISM